MKKSNSLFALSCFFSREFCRLVILVIVGIFICGVAVSQDVTRIRGKVFDGTTGEPLPFVDVGLKGTNVGVSTDLDGYYNIETRFPSDTVFAAFLGYTTQYKKIIIDETNVINFKLVEEGLVMEAVEIVEKKTKYSKKNNPALELAKKVIGNKYTNSLKGKEYYSYNQQEKINIDINNITEDFKNTPFIRKFDFMWDYVDTSEVNGKTYLPIFMRETLSSFHYKKDGNVLKEERKASKFTEIEESLDPQTVNDALDALYQDIDVYEEKIDLLELQFVSPFAKTGEDFYRYYIIDTTAVNGKEAINLAFIPAVKGNFGFTGNIFVSNDGKYTVLKVDMGIINGINVNFVRDLKIEQEFEPYGDDYIKTKDKLVIDYAITDNSFGLFGSRTLYFSDYNFEKPADESIFSGLEKVIYDENSNNQTDEYWEENRLEPLKKNDEELYVMVNQLRNDKNYKKYVHISKIIATGFVNVGPVSVGPVATFVNFNSVEGLNLRFGAETNPDFSKKMRFQGFLARAFKTDVWKYSAGFIYSFNDDYTLNPRHYISLQSQRESAFPGQDLDFFRPNNFLLSFQRGTATKMLLNETHEIKYLKEMSGFSYFINLRHKKRIPYGSLDFYNFDVEGNKQTLSDITTAEATLGVRFAPNEQFIQSKNGRKQIFNQYPIISLNYTHGFKDVLGGQYNFNRLALNVFKQIEWLTMGSTNFIFDAGKTWGDVPYILQHIPRGNQTYAYQLASFNMMNFMEFVTDQFISVKAEHYFYGRFLNKIPLIRQLKLREVVSIKALYGSLSEKNNPNLNKAEVQFPVDENNNPTTFLLDADRPYLELSVGFTNIFKVLRVDVVQRLNYLDQPNLPVLFGQKGMGIRATFHVEF